MSICLIGELLPAAGRGSVKSQDAGSEYQDNPAKSGHKFVVFKGISSCNRPGLEGGCCRFFDTQRAARHGAWFLITRLNHPGIATVQSHRSRCRSPQVRTRTIVAPRRIDRRLSPNKNSPVECLCLAKGRATGSARPARRVPVGFAVVPSPTASLGFDYAVCSPSPRTFALGRPPDNPSWGCPCCRPVLILAHDESKSVLPQGTCTQ